MQKRGASHHPSGDPRAALWATLTVVAFPIVAMSMGWFGVDPFTSFVFGAAASLLVLMLEAVIRGRWWISDPAIARVLGDPALGFRLLVLVGTVVLLFQTFVLVGFLTDESFDANVVRFVLHRQCDGKGSGLFARFCREADSLPTSTSINMISAAVRESAGKRFFAGGLVTCAVRPLASRFEPQTCMHGALVRCDRWVMSRIAGQPISVQTVQKPVVAALGIQSDGTYRILGWADDPSTPEWDAIDGPIAEATLRMNLERARNEDVDSQLAAETYRRVLEQVSSR
ncbi:MAG TPA: hypothetical protein VN397_01780 [Candidatus Methylomirabilis sp.]|nr:hypothetical protein [Candidatus Methylomirabilis sp.]